VTTFSRRIGSLIFFVALAALVCFGFIAQSRRESYRRVAGTYKIRASIFSSMGDSHIRQSLAEKRAALAFASIFSELKTDVERLAASVLTRDGQEAKEDEDAATWAYSMAEWCLRMERIYNRLSDRPWELSPQHPPPPKEPIRFSRWAR
jgi:hypothetical protein